MKKQVIEFIEAIQTPAKSLGLGRMENLMNRLGNPQDQLKIVHVAGTNGKGSVCAMLGSVLMEAGHTVGLFTSPHLITYEERLQINRMPISTDDFEEIALKVQKICSQIEEEGQEAPRFFDVMTAMAFVYFAKKEVDLVILETGIGGRYDATNIIKKPVLSVITSIGKDHMEFLGNTIESISREKGGIIKENCPTVLYHSDKSVYNIIKAICDKKNSPLLVGHGSLITNESYTMKGTSFNITNKHITYDDISLSLIGKYQVSNALTTLMAIESLKKSGYKIPRQTVYKGLEKASWPGRMEVIQKEPTIIIDGAHNEESAKAFIGSLKGLTGHAKLTMLIGVVTGKDYKTILEILVPFASTVIVTQTSHSRALPAKTLYDEISKMTNCPELILEENLIKAYKTGQELQKQDILCCVGSLYLVGELKQFLTRQEEKNVEF